MERELNHQTCEAQQTVSLENCSEQRIDCRKSFQVQRGEWDQL